MHRPLPVVLTAILLGVLTLGCADQQSPTAPFGSSPDGSQGAIVSRGELLIGFIVIDEERVLTSLISVPSDEIPGLISCGGAGETEPLDLLSVTRPTGANKFLLKSDEFAVVVWQFVSGDLCGALATTEPYAEGTARFRYTDNDFDFPLEPGGNPSTLPLWGL